MLSERDQAVIWHPFTQHQTAAAPLPIVRGEGAYLFDQKGCRYLDLISSWWTNIHGHAHPDIAKAIYEQALQLEHVIFSGFTHQPAVLLAEELLKILPSTFKKIYYSDNGSKAVEVALKMAYQYWRNVGEKQRTRFIAFENGYHGDTFGEMAVSKKSGFFGQCEDLFFNVELFAYPSMWLHDKDVSTKEEKILQQLSHHLENYGKETAALIIEPLIQGAGGMQMCRPEFLQRLESVVRSYGVLIIYDEVMTGFGRTGDYFACLKAHTTPDIICLAKGLTGGFLPLAVTACHERIYGSFLGKDFTNAFAHGHTFTANPLGCAAALASLTLLKKPDTWERIQKINAMHCTMLASLPGIKKPRICGTIAAFDLDVSMEYGSSLSQQLRERFLKRGLLLRPLGNVIYFLPPYCVTENELKHTYEIIIEELGSIDISLG